LASLSSLFHHDARSFGIRGVSNIVHSLGKLGERNPPIFTALDRNAAWLVSNGQPQNIANAAWACGALNVQSPALFRAIEGRGAWLVKNGERQAVANIAWACGKLGVLSPDLFRAIDGSAAAIVKGGFDVKGGAAGDKNKNDRTSQAVANIAWACAALGVQSPSLFRAIDESAESLIKSGEPQHIASMAWACAALNVPSPNLFLAIEERAEWIVKSGRKSREISDTAFAFAMLGVHSPPLFQAIDGHSPWLVRFGTPQEVADTCRAFSSVGVRPSRLFSCLAERPRLKQLAGRATADEACSLARSVATMGLANEKEIWVLKELWRAAMKAAKRAPEEISEEGLRDLARARVHARAWRVALSPPLPPALKARIVSACGELEAGGEDEAGEEGEASRLLEEAGFEHERDVSPFAEGGGEEGAAADDNVADDDLGEFFAIGLVCRRRKVVVELGRAGDFLTALKPGAAAKESGRTEERRRLLEKLGWKVVTVLLREIGRGEEEGSGEESEERNSKGGGTRELKKVYLRETLKKAGVALK